MAEYLQSVIPEISRIPKLDTGQQAHINTHSNKLLSPFTWSNINIKLPQLSKQTHNYNTIHEKPARKMAKLQPHSQLKDKIRLESINKTIDTQDRTKKQPKVDKVDEIKTRYRKQSIEAVNKSINLDVNEATNPEKIKQWKRDLIARHLQKSIKRDQSPKESLMNKTSLNFSRLRSPLSYVPKLHNGCTPQTFAYNKMETYQYKALIKSNWCEVTLKDSAILPELVWSDHHLDHTKLNTAQLHNHMKNAHLLTTKSSLHELQSIHGSEHYPLSFVMPFEYENFCEEYEQEIIRICLKDLIKNSYSKLNSSKKSSKSLAIILQEIKSSNKINFNEDTMMALRLCLYLEQYRKSKNYRYFENSEQYVPVETRLQPSVLSILLKACHDYWQNMIKSEDSGLAQTSLYFKFNNIDLDVLWVLWSYHCMFLKLEPGYQSLTNRNGWIVKPIASSKGAGIYLLKNSEQFFSINHDRFEMTNKTKFGNKIIQKYIEEPLLLKQNKDFSYRKFDIRQWVFLTCNKETGQPLVYIYEDAYCRFSDMKFTYNYYKSDEPKIHLTNYSVSDKSKPENSLMLLSELIKENQSLQSRYEQQINKIVIETVMNAKEISFEPNKFQLLGYDVIFDKNQKLWLLQVNLNPACESSRSTKLESIADRMIKDMMIIVKAASGKIFLQKKQRESLGWKLAYGEQNFQEVSFSQQNMQTQIKPFYSISLGSESLVEEVRRRSMMMNALLKIVPPANERKAWEILKQYVLHVKSQVEVKDPKSEKIKSKEGQQ